MRTPHVSYANVASTLALVIALSGGAYAASLPKKSVGTPQLKNNAVTTVKVKDGSLTAADFAPGVLTSGPAGPQGPSGPPGPRGPSGLTLAASDTAQLDFLDNCANNVVASVPVTPDRPSRVFGAATGTWASNETDPARFYSAQTRIRVVAGATTGATTAVESTSNNNERQSLATSGVLLDSTGAPVVLSAGTTYTVELVVQTFGSCAGSPLVLAAELSALLLAD